MLWFRPHNRFGPGLYLVGGGTHPCSGLPVIYEGARISAKLLIEELAGARAAENAGLPETAPLAASAKHLEEPGPPRHRPAAGAAAGGGDSHGGFRGDDRGRGGRGRARRRAGPRRPVPGGLSGEACGRGDSALAQGSEARFTFRGLPQGVYAVSPSRTSTAAASSTGRRWACLSNPTASPAMPGGGRGRISATPPSSCASPALPSACASPAPCRGADPMAPVACLAGVTLALRGRRVLDGIDLALAPGETLAARPERGGKTSLMRLVAGRLAPDAGTVRVGGADPHRVGEARRAVGWVPQDIALYPRLTVAENLSVFAQLAGCPGGSAAPPSSGR